MVNFWFKKHDKKLIAPKYKVFYENNWWHGLTIQLGYLELRIGKEKPMKSIPIEEILNDPYLSKLGKEIFILD